jgi:hypothetical protein
MQTQGLITIAATLFYGLMCVVVLVLVVVSSLLSMHESVNLRFGRRGVVGDMATP